MHDIRLIREQRDAFNAGLKRRGLAPMAQDILAIDARRRAAVTRAQELQTRRNELSKLIGQKKAKKEDASAEMDEVARSKDAQAAAEAEGKAAGDELDSLLAGIPNLPADEVPDGDDETANREVRRWGTPREFSFAPQDHVALGTALGLMDFETAAKMSGARFVVLSGALARLERALGAFMLDLHTQEYGYTEVNPPVLVRDNALFGTGQLPKFEEDLFRASYDEEVLVQDIDVRIKEIRISDSKSIYLYEPIDPNDQDVSALIESAEERKVVVGKRGPKRLILRKRRWMVPTAEVPLTNIVAGQILDEATLPRRYTAQTLSFRSEAGAAGKDTHGMIRQHQFTKVELVSIARPEDSEAEHERMTGCAEEVLKRLELPYRTMLLCSGDMGFAARKTYDIEVWLPGQGRYREISSCSNCGDFQARRMNARYRPKDGKGPRFVHTLNGSGLAVGRTLIAVLENYQQGNGTIAVPTGLVPYMGGMEVIGS